MSSVNGIEAAAAGTGGGSQAPQADLIPRKNLGFAAGGVVAVIVGYAVWLLSALGTQRVGLWVAIGFWVIAVVLGLCSVAVGSSERSKWKERSYKILVPITFNAPILIAAAVQLPGGVVSVERYLAVVVAVAVFVVVVLTALLKSNVSGIRRDALDLSLIAVGFVGAIATVLGVLTAE